MADWFFIVLFVSHFFIRILALWEERGLASVFISFGETLALPLSIACIMSHHMDEVENRLDKPRDGEGGR